MSWINKDREMMKEFFKKTDIITFFNYCFAVIILLLLFFMFLFVTLQK